MKRKKQILKRVGAFMCALFVSLSCIGSTPFYAADTSGEVLFDTYKDRYTYYNNSKIDLSKLPTDDTYCHYVILKYVNSDTYYCFVTSKTSLKLDVDSDSISKKAIWKYFFTGYVGYTSKDLVNWTKSTSSSTGWYWAYIYKDSGDDATNGMYLQYVASDIPIYAGSRQIEFNTKVETYAPSLGYLQDVKRQFIYLEDDAWDIVEDTASCKFSFSKTTTTGLDITDGNWSIRHYLQIEVKNAKKDYQTVELYDKVYMNEYSASDCKVIYKQKETLENLHTLSNFDGLSWWESNFLGYITYYNDYFQLVRTSDDGTVEYGGYVKVWQDEYNINHSTTLDEENNPDNNGYNDNVVDGGHGSGSTYEEAEKDAEKNELKENNKNNMDVSDIGNAIDNFTSTLGVIPSAIGSVFSFLPSWCQDLLGATFGLLCLLIVYKMLRG